MRRLLVLCLAVLCCPAGWSADLSSRQQRTVDAIGASIRRAGAEYGRGEYEASAEQIVRAMEQIDAASRAQTPELFDALEPLVQRVRTAHALLQLEGISMPPFRGPERPESSGGDSSPEPMPSGMDSVSFTADVAPILLDRCGRCHIDAARGQVEFESYAALMQGELIFAGDETASRLVATIESGDMPRGGGQVPAEELETLKRWIRDGAKFDGDDPQAAMAAATAPEPDSASGPTPVRRSTGEETVSFAADVAPLLVENCNGCHIDAMQTRGGLRLDTFAQMMRGGDSGPVLVPGDAADSLLIRKLQGTEGNRMPAGGRPPLSEDAIGLISTWIDEGATLDGASETQPLTVMSQLAWAEQATPAEMSQRRSELATEHLELVSASGEQATAETKHLFVAGTAPQSTIDRVGRLAEELLPSVRRTVPGDAGEAYFSGRATIFVLPQRYDYSEFAKMAEQRSVPRDWTSHWKYDGIEAYVAVVAAADVEDQQLTERLFGPIVSLAVASRGADVPRWFAEGVGVTLASREAGTRDREAIQRRQRETAEAVAAMDSAKAFLDQRLAPEQTDRIAAAVAGTLLEPARRRAFDRLMRSLRSGTPFDNAFAQSFGGPPEPFLEAWLKWARGASGG